MYEVTFSRFNPGESTVASLGAISGASIVAGNSRVRSEMRFSLALCLLFFYQPLQASDFLHVTDASQIRWQITAENKVYLRNLNTFDASFLPCCYEYWIDASTDAGKSFLAVLLARSAAGQSIDIGVASKASASLVNYVGAW